MCGIVGFAGFFEAGLLARMCNAIVHRGPDGEGMAELPDERMAIGMRRLAIIDLVTGDQPFVTPDEKVMLVFNGEIYNFRELRNELRAKGHSFHTQCDTEVVLAAYLEWGFDAWSRLHGMFALAIIDRRQPGARLIVVRDRVGMKPLYYAIRDGSFIFGSEMKALLAWSGIERNVELGALRDYLALRYVPGPGCLLVGIQKLPAGHTLIYEAGRISIRQWWTPPVPAAENFVSLDEGSRLLGEALRTAVRRHLVSDVPLGAFLSGGVDSNVIVALMAEVSSKPVRTLSIGFSDSPDDDQRLAAISARAIGTDHSEINCDASDFADLPDLAVKLDEPVGDAIIVPMSVLAREARKSVKVVLTGEGADEILGGYLFHRKLALLQRMRQLLPRPLWRVASGLVQAMPGVMLERLFDYPATLGDEGRRKIARLLRHVGCARLPDLYRSSIALFDSDDLAAGAVGALREFPERSVGPALPDDASATALQRLINYQWLDWLPDDILMKADKMTMAHSLEARIPFMDELVIQAAARLPDRSKVGGGQTKRALRQFAERLLPREIISAPKRAFYIPLERYVHTKPLSDILDWTLDPARLRRRGLFDPAWVMQQRQARAENGFLPLKRVFSIVMLELWFEHFCPDATWA